MTTNDPSIRYKFMTITIAPDNRLEHYYWEWCRYGEQIMSILSRTCIIVKLYPELHNDHHLHFHAMVQYHRSSDRKFYGSIMQLRKIGHIVYQTPRNFLASDEYCKKDLLYMQEQLGCHLPLVYERDVLTEDEIEYLEYRHIIDPESSIIGLS